MLDQNTDRMWYVIGAIIIGGLILTSSIILFTDVAFAGVQDTFDSLMSVSVSPDNNILTVDNMRHSHGAKSNLDDGGDLSKFKLEIYNSQRDYGTGGIELNHKDIDFKPNTEYILSYEYQKISGTLKNFGGHIEDGFKGKGSTSLYVNGVDRGVNYHDFDSVFVDDSTNRQSVEVHFTTNSEFKDDERNHIWIQPNRGSRTDVVLNIYNLKLVEKGD